VKFAVIGANGCIGRVSVRVLKARGDEVVPCSSTKSSEEMLHVDLTKHETWQNLPKHLDGVLVCAGEGSLRQCRAMPEETAAVNVSGTAGFVAKLQSAGVFSVVISTNYVFDGTRGDFSPQDMVSPACEYGHQKARLEQAVRAWEGGGGVAIVRLTKVLSDHNLLLQSWASRLRQGQPVVAARDARAAFLTPDAVAEGLVRVLAGSKTGLWQLSASDDLAWAEVAVTLCDELGLTRDLVIGKELMDIDPKTEFVPLHGTLAAVMPGGTETLPSMLAVRRCLESICGRR